MKINLDKDSEMFAFTIITIGIVVFCAGLGALILLLDPPSYEIPSTQKPAFSFQDAPISIRIGKRALTLPSNYIRKVERDQNQKVKTISIHALLPKIIGYQKDNWWFFENKTTSSRLVEITLTHKPNEASEDVIFIHLLGAQLQSEPSFIKRAGLSHYMYKKSAARPRQEIYTIFLDGKNLGAKNFGGKRLNERQRLIYFCFQPSAVSVSPACHRSFYIAPDIILTYHFKRAHIDSWRNINQRITDFFQQAIAPFEGQ